MSRSELVMAMRTSVTFASTTSVSSTTMVCTACSNSALDASRPPANGAGGKTLAPGAMLYVTTPSSIGLGAPGHFVQVAQNGKSDPRMVVIDLLAGADGNLAQGTATVTPYPTSRNMPIAPIGSSTIRTGFAMVSKNAAGANELGVWTFDASADRTDTRVAVRALDTAGAPSMCRLAGGAGVGDVALGTWDGFGRLQVQAARIYR